jgi:hypothetical protein
LIQHRFFAQGDMDKQRQNQMSFAAPLRTEKPRVSPRRLTMNRTTFLIAILLVPIGFSFAQTAKRAAPVTKPGSAKPADKTLQHNWSKEESNGALTFTSNYPAPVPFSMTGEPEATLAVEMEEISGTPPSLNEVVKTEIKGIRKGLQIAEYLEDDGHKPEGDIASWVEDIEGQQVAFIKYRVAGVKGEPRILPRTIRHAILIRNGELYFLHLTVIFAEHQEEVRADQIRLVKGIIRR